MPDEPREPRLLSDDFHWDNLWESEEARDAIATWLEHPGYEYFKRRCRIAEVQQLRLALTPGTTDYEGGVFTGMVRVRRLPELMLSESKVLQTGACEIPDTDPDSLHAALLLLMSEWGSRGDS